MNVDVMEHPVIKDLKLYTCCNRPSLGLDLNEVQS